MTTVSTGPLLIDGRYRLGEVLGIGRAAVVRRAYDERLRRDVAVKIIPPCSDDERRHSVDLTLMASLAHPAMVRMYDGGQVIDSDGAESVYLVMELVSGPTLDHALEGGAPSRADVAAIGADLAAALTYLHAHDVVHSDISPANVLLSLGDRVTAKLDGVGVTRVPDSGMPTSTADGLGPEHARGKAIGPASDIYALGLLLLAALTAPDGTDGAADQSWPDGSPVIPATLGPEWSKLLGAMLDDDPTARPDAASVRRGLASVETNTAPASVETNTAPASVETSAAPRLAAAAVTASKMAAEQREDPRGHAAGRVHAELAETRHGWVLTLRTDAARAEVLRVNGIGAERPGRLTVSISPNLVPGEPFDVGRVEIAVDP